MRGMPLNLLLILALSLSLHLPRKPPPLYRGSDSDRNRSSGGSRCRNVSVDRGGWQSAVAVVRCPGLLRCVSHCNPVTDTVDGLGHCQRRGHRESLDTVFILPRFVILFLFILFIDVHFLLHRFMIAEDRNAPDRPERNVERRVFFLDDPLMVLFVFMCSGSRRAAPCQGQAGSSRSLRDP